MDFARAGNLERLRSETFDVLVIGGGITGLGVALDAASRGLSVGLIEKDDFSSGTSSKSSKLIHGGLRYLQQGEIGLVYEALHERQRLVRNAPHLVNILPFMIPILTRDGVISKKIARALGSALWMYDLTGGWRIGKIHRRLNSSKAHAHIPTMNKEKLAAAYMYYDASADDSRLCIAIARTAAKAGAAIANQCAVQTITHGADGRANGAVVETALGKQFTIAARSVVNAAGVWADNIRKADEGTDPHSIRPAKGVHITVPWKMVRNDIAVVIPVRRDKRSLFVVPWISNGDGTFQYTYVGTTDTDFAGAVDESQSSIEDIDYVLEALNQSINTNISADDVTAVWSGLRPLVRNEAGSTASGKTADLSRKHQVRVSASGVVSIAGGKLTTYRKMAEHTVDEVLRQISQKATCKTKQLRLIGADGFSKKLLSTSEAHLITRYGSEISVIKQLIEADAGLGDPLIVGLPYLRAEAIFAIRFEMANTLDDVLSRRTRARIINRQATLAGARPVAQLMAREIGWNEDETERQIAQFVDSCSRESAAGEVTEAEYLASSAPQHS
jgi:glycerol-3-phosphate dehydrogenase